MTRAGDRVHAIEQPFGIGTHARKVGRIPGESTIRPTRAGSNQSAPRPLISRYLFTTAAVMAWGDTSSTLTPARRIRSSTA